MKAHTCSGGMDNQRRVRRRGNDIDVLLVERTVDEFPGDFPELSLQGLDVFCRVGSLESFDEVVLVWTGCQVMVSR